jgi:hypothetical protein
MNKNQLISKALEIEGMVSEWDLDLIYDQAMEYIKPGGAALEIGGWKGTSTFLIASVCKEKGAKLYEIDTYRGVEDPNSDKNQPGNLGGYNEAFINPDFYRIAKENLKELPVEFLIGDSNRMIHEVPDGSIDYAFIDGNHRPPTIDNDIKNTIRKMKIGGLLTGHDHGNPDGDVHGALERIGWKVHQDIHFNTRPVVGDPKYALTIWSRVIEEKDYEI